MKKTTCQVLGGNCDAEIQGATPEEMAQNAKMHVHEAAESGNEEHKAMMEKMQNASEEDKQKWMADLNEKFESMESAE
ncbi:MAG: hypothetical protein ACPGO5_04640 [Patescibacteria group bacterium]